MKRILILIVLQTCIWQSYAQITVDANQLSEEIQEKLIGEITDKITSSIQSGEKWVVNETYFSEVLEPFKDFGIDPSDPNFLNQAYEIHSKIEDKIQKNPRLKYRSLLKDEVMDIVFSGLQNYASSKIDQESIDIYNETRNLFTAGKEKIDQLLQATEGIVELDPSDDDYQSEITSILRKYGIKSDYFNVIDDLDLIVSKTYEDLADPLEALAIISDAMSSNNPTEKIQMLFELGESFGGKVPIIGDLITPLFTLGKGVLDAAMGLENVLERNLNQGCISQDGTYASTNPNKRSNFLKKFPNVEYVCPMYQKKYHPVYTNIYYSLDNSNEIYFYLNNIWLRGKKDQEHAGTEDIYAAIRWLRHYQETEKAVDLEFIFTVYQKEYGWSIYTKEVEEKIQRILELFHHSYETVNFCEVDKLKDFYLNKIGFSWLTLLLESNGLNYGWDELKSEVIFQNNTLRDAMIRNYYLSKHKANLTHFDRIIKNLETNMPVQISGTVSEFNGSPIKNARLQVGLNSMFGKNDKDHKTTTSKSGYFSYFLLMELDKPVKITVSATTPKSDVIIEDLEVHPQLKTNSYTANLILGLEKSDTTSNQSNDTSSTVSIADMISSSDCAKDPKGIAEWDPVNEVVVCSCIDNYKWDEAQKKCITIEQAALNESACASDPHGHPQWDSINQVVVCNCDEDFSWDEIQKKCLSNMQTLLEHADCAGVQGATAEWDPVTGQVNCSCTDPYYTWDANQKKCVPNIQSILDNSDCSQWPNTEPKWDYGNNEPYCDCMAGYTWDENYEKCISLPERLVAESDCSQYPNAEPVWDPVSEQVMCECKAGYEWDETDTKCVSIMMAQVQDFDCSYLPNTEPVWDPVNEEVYCDCKPGYEWAADLQGCKKIGQEENQTQTQEQTQTEDCSNYPNSQAIWDPSSEQYICDCKPGFQWNSRRTACEPITKKPSVNWGDVLNVAVGILDAANTGNNSFLTSFANSGSSGSSSSQQTVRHQSNCNDQQQAGGDAAEVHTIDLGQSSGSFVFDYNVYSVKDQIIVAQGNRTIYNTGCVSGSKSVTLKLSGYGNRVTVRVNPNCSSSTSGTKWNFTVHCPK